MAVDPEKKKATYRKWYARHRTKYNELRRQKYSEDPEYRAKMQKLAREGKRRRTREALERSGSSAGNS